MYSAQAVSLLTLRINTPHIWMWMCGFVEEDGSPDGLCRICLFGALRGDASHFVHGVNYEGFVCHSGVILLYVLNTKDILRQAQDKHEHEVVWDEKNPHLS